MGLVQSFCCGCSLQSGTIVSGIMSTFRGIAYIVYGCFFLVHVHPYDPYAGHDGPRPSTQDDDEPGRKVIIAAGTIVIGIGLIVISVSGLLFLGISKRKPGYLLPWIVWQSLEFFLATCFFVLRCIGGGRTMLPDRGGGPFSTVFMVYLYIVVLSYYKALQAPPPTQIPMAVRMTQINVNPTGYANQPGYVVTLAGPASPMAPKPGFGPLSPGMPTPIAVAYDPRTQALSPMPGYPNAPGMMPPPPPPGFAPPIDATSGMPLQYSQNPEYPGNPPPYSAPPPYSQV